MSCLKKIRWIVALILISAAVTALASPAKLIKIIDGDTIKAQVNGDLPHIRLWGIDAPEAGQAGGDLATTTVQRLLAGRKITVQPIDRDRYGRTVAVVYTDGDERSVNEAMIRAGAAWVYTKYCTKPICSQWSQYQQAAQAAGIGLWRDKAPVPPWEWRRGDESKLVTLVSASADAMGAYIGNTNSRKFHAADCRHAGCKHCTAVFSSRSEAIAAGYIPCKVCRP
ncbi:thermonuclease family protein [Desulfobulbus elongatus]|uniref:thermonuclease family protein n=1 Tax=Desulfobulbus elongatus TaxID=53332 RepID=UPI000688981A|nr:thermonuclease family protein [Desulfobulbus elongatus]